MNQKDHLKYFNQIAKKISSNVEKYTDTCYKTAMTMMIYFSRQYKKPIKSYTIKNTTELEYFISNIIIPNQNILFDIEYHANTLTKYTMEERHALMNKYQIEMIPRTFVNFAFHKPNIRFVSHAHNALVINDDIYLAQSWLGLQTYHIFSNPNIHSRESMISWLKAMHVKMESDTRNFIDNFDHKYDYTDDQKRIINNNNKINEMIISENIPYKSFLEVYYVIL